MEESYVSLAELKVILEKEKTARGELNPEQQYSLSHAALFARVPADKVPAIVKELMEIPMMSPFNAMKIVDLLPTHLDDVGDLREGAIRFIQRGCGQSPRDRGEVPLTRRGPWKITPASSI